MYDLRDQSPCLKSPRRTNTTQHTGDIEQAELQLKYLFLLAVQHTLYHLLKLYRSRGNNQLACLQEPCQTTPKQRPPDNRTSSVSFALHTKSYGYPKRKLVLLKKGVFIFSPRRDYKKSVQAFSTKNNIWRKKKKLWLWHSRSTPRSWSKTSEQGLKSGSQCSRQYCSNQNLFSSVHQLSVDVFPLLPRQPHNNKASPRICRFLNFLWEFSLKLITHL